MLSSLKPKRRKVHREMPPHLNWKVLQKSYSIAHQHQHQQRPRPRQHRHRQVHPKTMHLGIVRKKLPEHRQ